jgi:hypothetical protein
MSRKNLVGFKKKTFSQEYFDLIVRYRAEHGPGVRLEDIGKWIADTKQLPDPKVSPARYHTRNLKNAARRSRSVDPQKRKHRTMVPAKFEKVDAAGNLVFDVIWDFLHEASLTHLLTHFSQRDETIDKQKRSATRDVESALDNNPNLAGCKDQFQFGFMTEEPLPQVQQSIEESETKRPDAPDLDDLGQKKPR